MSMLNVVLSLQKILKDKRDSGVHFVFKEFGGSGFEITASLGKDSVVRILSYGYFEKTDDPDAELKRIMDEMEDALLDNKDTIIF